MKFDALSKLKVGTIDNNICSGFKSSNCNLAYCRGNYKVSLCLYNVEGSKKGSLFLCAGSGNFVNRTKTDLTGLGKLRNNNRDSISVVRLEVFF